jgi:hypothetical protein
LPNGGGDRDDPAGQAPKATGRGRAAAGGNDREAKQRPGEKGNRQRMAVVRVKQDIASVPTSKLPKQVHEGMEGAGVEGQLPGGRVHAGARGVEGSGERGTLSGHDMLQETAPAGQRLNQQANLSLPAAPLASAANMNGDRAPHFTRGRRFGASRAVRPG